VQDEFRLLVKNNPSLLLKCCGKVSLKIILVLLITQCVLGQYLVANLFNSTTCSGSSYGFFAYPTACTYDGFIYTTVSCSGGNYTIKSCTDSSCTNCSNAISMPTTCNQFQGINYATASCTSLPNFSSYVVANLYNSANNCSGALNNIVGIVTGQCYKYGASNSAILKCNSTYINEMICGDNACSVNCSTTYLAVGCNTTTSTVQYACGANIHSSHPNSSSQLSVNSNLILFLFFMFMFCIKSKK